MKKIRCLLFTSALVLSACTKPVVKTGYVEVPTVTEHALSGIYSLLEPTSPTTRLYYEECGQGEPIILLHDQAVDCRMWDDVFFKLAKNFRVIRYDLRGYGKSGNPESGYGYLHVDDLKNLMVGLKIKSAHFAGLSLGGMTLTEFIALYPDRVLTATISSGAISEYPNRAAMPKNILKIYNDTVFSIKKQDVERTKLRGLDAEKNDWKMMMRSVSGEHFQDISDNLNQMIDDWTGWQLINPETDAFIGLQAEDSLVKHKKKPRILLIIGQHDSARSKKSMQRMAILCQDAKIQLMSDVGHFTCMESPNKFVEKMLTFIHKK